MGSPVHFRFDNFIKINRGAETTIYMQIVNQFVDAIKRSLLEDGDRLPGSRQMAADLKIHRKTIVAALDELQQQGWIKTVPNIGTFVKNPELSGSGNPDASVFRQPPEKAPFPFNRESILDIPALETAGKVYFTDGTPDYRVVGAEELIRAYGSVFKRKKRIGTLSDADQENLFFREQLSYYLNLSRGLRISRSLLLPIAGREQVFTILSRLLINTGDVVLVERLSYFLPNMIFSQAGARIKTVPLDEDGMDVDYIRDHFKPGEIRFVYLNTTCQYPSAAVLSEARKTRLLDLAEAYGFIVIEDDVDFEFAMSRNKAASLFKKNAGTRVIYIGAFGRFLHPGFQMNFLVAPKDLLEEGRKYLNIFGKPNPMLEKALGEIMLQGDILRYQRKSNKVLGERKEAFAALLDLYFGDRIRFKVPVAGLAYWIRFTGFISLVRLQGRAKAKGLVIPGVCLYQNQTTIALRLGFAHLNPQEMESAIRILHEAYVEVAE